MYHPNLVSLSSTLILFSVLATVPGSYQVDSRVEIPEPRHLDYADNIIPNSDDRVSHHHNHYFPNWPSLDSRPLPSWYDKAKIGIKANWGVFSVVGIDGPWFWHCWKEGKEKDCRDYVEKNFNPGFTYQELGPEFTASFFNATEWVELFEKAGARYVLVTGKHHDGFALYPSKTSFGWNSVDIGPHRDIVREFEEAVRARDSLKFGIYHSLYEWYNPLYLKDKRNGFRSQDFVINKIIPELQEMVVKYKPDIIWSDGEWEAPDLYWKSMDFLAWIYNESPVKGHIITNDRWGTGTMCNHGGFWTCKDRYNPGVLQPHKWENCMSLHKDSWSYRVNAKAHDFFTTEELITTLIETVSCGGNLLINIGPTKGGIIQPIVEERLLQMGEWLRINGEAIYETVPWIVQQDVISPFVWYTSNPHKSRVFGIMTKWPGKTITLEALDGDRITTVSMLGYDGDSLSFMKTRNGTAIQIQLPNQCDVKSKWGWVLMFQII